MFRGSLVFAVSALVAVVACAPFANSSSTDQWEVASSPAEPSGRVSPRPYFEDVGCTSVNGVPDSATIAVAEPDSGARLFSCPGVGAEIVGQALRRFHAAVLAATNGMALYVPGHLETFVVVREWCRPTSGEWIGTVYYLDDDGVLYDCRDIPTWYDVWIPGRELPGTNDPGTGNPTAPDIDGDEVDEFACDRRDVGCLVRLNSKQLRYFRSALALADTTRPICREGLNGMRRALSEGKVFMGKEGLADDPTLVHDGLTYTTRNTATGSVRLVDTHFDIETYKLAVAHGKVGLEGFARLLLHEGLHVAGYSHPASDGVGGNYVTSPFNNTSLGSAVNGCLR